MELLNVQSIKDPETGQEGLFFFSKDGQVVSPWHEVPLIADKHQNLFHMVVEIPRGTRAKMEVGVLSMLYGSMLTISKISKEEQHNPIQQDSSSDGKPRGLFDIPPFSGYPCNYGALPQVSCFYHRNASSQSLGLTDVLR